MSERPAGSTVQEQPVAPRGLLADVADAVAPRTVLLVVGVLLIQLAFVLSYVGAFHRPTPHRVPVVLVAPASISGRLAAELNTIPGEPLRVTPVASEDRARTLLAQGSTSGALVVNPGGSSDSLLVAGGGGANLVTAVQEVFTRVEATQHRTITVTDVVPSQPGDRGGLSGFYLIIGWLVGGYLVAALLGVSRGARPATFRRAVIRLGAMVPYAVLSGLGGALIVGPWLRSLTGHLVALWWLGALLVFCAAAVTIALEILLGVIGVGVTVVLFVVLGNPSAGGAFPAPLLPPFWRAIGSSIPNGAGVQAVRAIVYFGGHGVGGNLLVIALYAVAGVAVALVAAWFLVGRAGPSNPALAIPSGRRSRP